MKTALGSASSSVANASAGSARAGARVKPLLDERYANQIATKLRPAGHDAVTVSKLQIKGIGDESLLELASSEDRLCSPTTHATNRQPLGDIREEPLRSSSHLRRERAPPQGHRPTRRADPASNHGCELGPPRAREPGVLAALTDHPRRGT
jgi:hypothetical protein